MANKMKCVNALNRASFISTSKAIANPLEIQSVNALNRASFISTLAFWNSLFKWLLRN